MSPRAEWQGTLPTAEQRWRPQPRCSWSKSPDSSGLSGSYHRAPRLHAWLAHCRHLPGLLLLQVPKPPPWADTEVPSCGTHTAPSPCWLCPPSCPCAAGPSSHEAFTTFLPCQGQQQSIWPDYRLLRSHLRCAGFAVGWALRVPKQIAQLSHYRRNQGGQTWFTLDKSTLAQIMSCHSNTWK